MNRLKKTGKGIAVFIVLCLAAYGTFVLFKRPPKLEVSEADRVALQEIGVNVLSNDTSSGRSAVFNTAHGVPPVGARSPGTGKTGLPAAFINSEAPSFGDAPAFDDAPVFTTFPAQTEAPPFTAPPIPTEAPPFTSTISPSQKPSAAITAPPVPQYGNQQPFDAVPQEPAAPPGNLSIPAVDPFSPPVLPPVSVVPSAPTYSDSHWDGPATNPMQPVDPWATTATPFAATTTEPETTGVVTFVPPTIRRLPKVEEEPPVQVVVAPPIPVQIEPALQPIPTIAAFPEEYRQASIRRLSTAPVADAAPVVSFLPLGSTPPNEPRVEQLIEEPVSSPVFEKTPLESVATTASAAIAVPNFVEPTTTPTVVPASVPFTVETPLLPEPIEVRPIVTLPSSPREIKPEVRESVIQAVKTQSELIQTNDPNKIRHAYVQLSKLYDHPDLNAFERAYLTPVLDRLAIDVIFSRRNHVLEAPYVVKVGETAYTLRSGEVLTVRHGNSIDSIAATFNLTPALLMKINGLTSKRPLEPGAELKVVFGQFDGRVSTERREFTLILGGLYAGRFPIAVGEDVQNVEGDFTVTLKGDTPQGRRLTLSNGITLRGVDQPQPGDSLRSVVRFSERDAGELYDILSERSIIAIGK